MKIELPAVGAVIATDIWSNASNPSKLVGVTVKLAPTTPLSAKTSRARASTSAAVAPRRVPTRQASKLQTESDSRRYSPAVISRVPSISMMISGKQNAASTAATPERLVRVLNLDFLRLCSLFFGSRKEGVFCWNIMVSC